MSVFILVFNDAGSVVTVGAPNSWSWWRLTRRFNTKRKGQKANKYSNNPIIDSSVWHWSQHVAPCWELHQHPFQETSQNKTSGGDDDNLWCEEISSTSRSGFQLKGIVTEMCSVPSLCFVSNTNLRSQLQQVHLAALTAAERVVCTAMIQRSRCITDLMTEHASRHWLGIFGHITASVFRLCVIGVCYR